MAWSDAATAQAQPDEGPRAITAGDRETARSLMDAGDAKMAAGDYAGTLEAYLAADKIMGVPTTGIDLGRAQAKLGMLLEARDTWLRVTRYPARSDEPDVFTRAREDARALAKLIAGRIPSLQIEVAGVADDVPITVTVDGVTLPAGTHRFPRKVNPGYKTITATAPDHSEARQAVDVAQAEERVVKLTLAPLTHVPEPTTSPLVYVGFGIGGVGLIAGTITGVLSLAQASDIKDRCDGTTCPRSAQEDIDSAKVVANVSNVAFAIGGVGVGLGVLGLFLPGEAEPAQAPPGQVAGLEVEPLVGPGWLGLGGRF